MYPWQPRVLRTRAGALVLVSVLLCLVVAACTSPAGPEPDAPSSSPTSPSPSSAGPVTITFSVYGDRDSLAAYRKLAAAFTAQQPNVTVDIQTSPDAETSADALDRGIGAGTAPDVFLADHAAVPALLADDLVLPVDQLLEERGVLFADRFERLGLEAFAADSALQCMPNDVSPYVIYYNRRLLVPSSLADPGEEPPTPETGWTWEQFTAAAQRMSTNAVKGVFLAPRLTTLTPLIRSAGEDVVDDPRTPTTLTFSDDGTRAALEQVLDLARDTRVTPTPEQLDRQDAVTRFERGRLGMLIGTRALVPRLRQQTDLNFDVFPLPSLGRTRTVAEVSGYCISADSEHVNEAADFLAFASGDEGAAITAESGSIVPANLAALHSDSFVDPGEFPRNVQVFSEAIPRAESMPIAPDWPDVVRQTQPYVDRLFYAPVLDLDTLLPRIDELSVALLAEPTESAAP